VAGLTVTVVMCAYNEVARTRACLESLRATTTPFSLVLMDNGSTDDTPNVIRSSSYPFPIDYVRSDTNQPVIATLNQGWRRAKSDVICFLHNDTEMPDPAWLAKLTTALISERVGLAGLYGAKRVRTTGTLSGRTIVHSLAPTPTVKAPWEEVAFVDSVCMTLRRETLEQVGGLDESYGFYHGLDRELSFRIRSTGLKCVVVHTRFIHHGGATRTREFQAKPTSERTDLSARAIAMKKFATKWRASLPADVRSPRERLFSWLKSRVARA